jgi:hypothetical protein
MTEMKSELLQIITAKLAVIAQDSVFCSLRGTLETYKTQA